MSDEYNNRRNIKKMLYLLPLLLLSIIVFDNINQNLFAYGFIIPNSSRKNTKRNILIYENSNESFSNMNESFLKTEKVRLGFIGCGTIAAAIVKGLLTTEPPRKNSLLPIPIESIAVTSRSKQKSNSLKQSFPDVVHIYENGAQSILDNADVIFVCLLPEQISQMISSLKFDCKRHTLVSLASSNTLDELIKDSCLPPEKVYRMICLPSVARQQGGCLVVPKGNTLLKRMFESLGGCFECENEDIMKAMMIPGCLMGPLYAILQSNRDWLVKHGVPKGDASHFVAKQYLSMMQDAEFDSRNPSRFDDLVNEQTPGGLNEQSIENLKELNVFKDYEEVMDAILSRLEGKTNGFISSRNS